MLKKATDFELDERVTHVSHGDGTVYLYGHFDDEIFVEFDIKPDGWDNPLCVSPQNLKKI